MDDNEKKRLTSTVGTKGNVRYITITDNVPEHWDALISIAKSTYQWYAYIFHDKDETEKHIHLLCYDKGGTTLKSHCDRFSSVVPSNFVLKVFNPRAMARYLIHKDNLEKFQYSPELVFTNSKDKFSTFLLEIETDVKQQYHDYVAVLRGELSVDDFMEKYRAEFASSPFYHRCNLFHKLASSSPPISHHV